MNRLAIAPVYPALTNIVSAGDASEFTDWHERTIEMAKKLQDTVKKFSRPWSTLHDSMPAMEGLSQGSKKEQFPRPIVALEDVKTPEEFLQALDFNVINDIFDTLVRKAEDGQPASTSGHRISPELVTFDMSAQSKEEELILSGSVNVHSGDIALLWREDNPSKSPTHRVIRTLASLMHEATHVRGGYKTELWERINEHDAGWVMGTIFRKGLSESRAETSHDKGYVKEKIALSLNEALTEDISHEVLHEYLIRTGNSVFLNNPDLVSVLNSYQSYSVDRFVFAVVIDVLAKELEVPGDEVRKGFVQAYMSGNMNVKQLLADIERELESTPDIAELIPLLAANQSLFESELLTEHDVIDRIKIPHNLIEILEGVINTFDAKKFKNSLNLR